jgi:PAS domain S-box-containing protein
VRWEDVEAGWGAGRHSGAKEGSVGAALEVLASLTAVPKARNEPDALAVRVVARIRVAVAIGVAAAGSFLPEVTGRRMWLYLVIGLLYVPWASIVLLAADSPTSRLSVLGGPAGDLLVVFALQLLAPGISDAALPGYVAVVAFAAYTGGRVFASCLAAGALTLALAAQQLAPWIRHDGSSVALLGAVLVALVLLLDRTASMQRRAVDRSARLEGRSDAILAHIADGVLVTDAMSHVVQCNPAVARLLGRAEAELLGKHCSEVLGLRAGERELDCSQGCALLAGGAAGDAALGREVWRFGPGGRRQPLLANAVAVGDGGAPEVVHSLRDITSLKQADEAKTLFLATASHELRTPLTVISGFASTLRSDPIADPEMRDRALAAIERRSAELTKIIDRLLLSSRIEAGRIDLKLSEVALGPLLRERAEALAAATGRPVVLEADDDALPAVRGDAQAVVTVVDHLLDNAIKYSPGGEPVALNAHLMGDSVRVQVRDAGVGMDAEQAARCFDKFWQAESTDVRRFGGTGIGLYIVKSLVEAMRGDIGVESAPGAGTTFTVTLRRADAEAPAEEPAPPKEPSVIREFMRQIGVPMRIEA